MRFKVFKRGGYNSGGFTLTGGTVNGPLMLSRDPVQALEAANKSYVDIRFNNLDGSNFKSGTIPVAALPSFSGDVVNTAGSSQFVLNVTGVSPGTYPKVAVDAKGRVTNGYALTAEDIPNVSWLKINSGKPTTLVGYGITDALKPEGGVLTGVLKTTVTPTAALHVANKAYVDSKTGNSDGVLVAGDIIRKLSSTTPTGFLRANGGEVAKADYPALYSAIGDGFSTSSFLGNGTYWKTQHNLITDPTVTGQISGPVSATLLPSIFGNFVSEGTSFVTKNRVYYIGGVYTSSSIIRSTIFTAPVNYDGTLGTWVSSGNFPMNIRSASAVVTVNRVYMIGASSRHYANIQNDGTLGNWTLDSTIPEIVGRAHPVLHKDRLYVFTENKVYTALLNKEDGSFYAWSILKTLSVMSSMTYVCVKDFIYFINFVDGYTSIFNGTVPAKTVTYRMNINADGSLTDPVDINNNLPYTLQVGDIITTKSKIYVLGTYFYSDGWAGNGHVLSCDINPDGSLGSWTNAGYLEANGYGYYNFSTFILKNSVYTLGGYSYWENSGRDVYYIFKLNLNGGLNDYSPYYDGSFTPTDPTKFRLPDYSSKELSGSYTYIKY